MQVRASSGGKDSMPEGPVVIPVAGCCWRENAGKSEGHQVRLVKVDSISWGLQ